MSDHDRLTDYVARMENPDHLRTLSDGCPSCGHSAVYCRCVRYIDGEACCGTCGH